MEAMVGARAEALEDFAGAGAVWAFGERWRAVSETPVQKGDKLRVTAVDGLTLTVTRE
jgi:membrane-bound serine protease (ClpP class)